MKTWITFQGVQITRLLSGRCNCHLIQGEDGFLLVDCGGRHSRKKLRRRLIALGIGRDGPLTLVLTHTHFDHAENAAALRREFNARTIVHETEAHNLKRGENPLIRGTNPFLRFLIRLGERSKVMARMGYTGTAADLTVNDRYDLRPLGFPAVIIHTPGHTGGSTSVIADNEIALVGDTLFGIFPGSAFPPFAQDPPQLVNSWGRLLDTRCTLYLPAHGRARTRALLLRRYKKYREKFGS